MNSQTAYRKAYTEKRMAEARAFLGNTCVICGTDQELEFDHVDPSTKEIDISTAIQYRCWSWKRLILELTKCQLLCKEHHIAKTSQQTYGEQPCGTYWKYRKYKCRCSACVAAGKLKMKEYKQRYKAKQERSSS